MIEATAARTSTNQLNKAVTAWRIASRILLALSVSATLLVAIYAARESFDVQSGLLRLACDATGRGCFQLVSRSVSDSPFNDRIQIRTAEFCDRQPALQDCWTNAKLSLLTDAAPESLHETDANIARQARNQLVAVLAVGKLACNRGIHEACEWMIRVYSDGQCISRDDEQVALFRYESCLLGSAYRCYQLKSAGEFTNTSLTRYDKQVIAQQLARVSSRMQGAEAGSLLLSAYEDGVLDRSFVDFLRSNGGDINAVDQDGMTLLHHAVIGGDLSDAQWLLEQGITANSAPIDWPTMTPLRLAVEHHHIEIAELLLARGANPGTTVIRDSPISIATALHDVEMIRLLENHRE
ncbi:MAG: ankyrin repeat domain-containing protein [Gammaproteobacteria bacterium]